MVAPRRALARDGGPERRPGGSSRAPRARLRIFEPASAGPRRDRGTRRARREGGGVTDRRGRRALLRARGPESGGCRRRASPHLLIAILCALAVAIATP